MNHFAQRESWKKIIDINHDIKSYSYKLSPTAIH